MTDYEKTIEAINESVNSADCDLRDRRILKGIKTVMEENLKALSLLNLYLNGIAEKEKENDGD